MAENLGAIRYEVEVETASMLKAEGLIDKSISGIVADFDKADKAVREFTTTQKNLGRTINSMGQVLNSNGKVITNATQQYRKLASEAQTGFTTLNTQINGTSKAVRSAMPNMANMSYQIQDIAVQAQMGTSWLVIFAQQFPQMAVGMGAAAGAAGAAVAIIGSLGTALIDTTTSLQRMEKAVEQVKAVMTVGADGVANYSEEMEKLNRISQDLARAKIDAAIIAQEKALSEGLKAMEESFRDFGSFYDDRATKIAENTKLPISALNDLDRAFRLQGAKVGQDDIQRFEDAIEALRVGLPNANKKGREMFATLTDLVAQLSIGAERLNRLNESTDNTSDAITKVSSKAADMTLELITQKIALEDGERAALQFKLQMDGLTEAQKKQVLALYDANKATEASIEASKESSKALEDEIDAYIKIGDEAVKAAEKKEAASQREQERLARRGSTVGLTEVQTIEMQYEADLEALRAYFGEDYAIKEEYARRELELNRQKQEAIRQSQSETNQFMQDAFGNLDTQIAGTMAQVVVGAKDGKEAMRSLANTMLTQVVGAAVQYGIELVKNRVLGQALATSEQANIAATTATGIASQQAATTSTVASAAATATAAAPAAALTSTFSFGSAAVIGGIALLGTLAIAKMMGGRQYGGPVSSGMYRVNETGAPEVYSYGGKDYLMNTKNANIKNLSQGGGGGMTVNISNNTPYEVFVTQDQAAQIANVQIGKEAGKAAKGQGQMLRGMQKGTNLQRNARS